MGETNPGFSGFMNNVMKGNDTTNLNRPPPQAPPPPQRKPPPQPQQNNDNFEPPERSMKNDINAQTRPEMKGPSDISHILGGLKTKTINIASPENEGSTVSLSELKEMNNSLSGAVQPKKAVNVKNLTKNTVSIAL